MRNRQSTTRNGARVVAMEDHDEAETKRPRGRPRLDVDMDAVADAVATLFRAGGFESVTVGSTAEMLGVSRATLYRTVPTKEDLLGVLFERGTRELTDDARKIIARERRMREQLIALVELQIEAAIRMRMYMFVFFGGAGLPPEVFERWHAWSKQYEAMWVTSVTKAMRAGVLPTGDPVVTTRLLLGMCIWVSRWFRTSDGYTAETISAAAIKLLGFNTESPKPTPPTRSTRRSPVASNTRPATARSKDGKRSKSA